MTTGKKFVGEPRHALDIKWQKNAGKRLDALLNARIMDKKGNVIGQIDVADGNIVFKLQSDSGVDSTAAFVITELGHQDYFVARQLSNVRLDSETGLPIADVGAVDIKIAKVVNVRRTIFTQLLYGDTVTYTDDDPADIDNTRIANNGVDPAEPQNCLPPYITLAALGFTDTVPTNAQCVVYAKKMPGLTGVFDGETQLEWIEDAGQMGERAFAERNPPS